MVIVILINVPIQWRRIYKVLITMQSAYQVLDKQLLFYPEITETIRVSKYAERQREDRSRNGDIQEIRDVRTLKAHTLLLPFTMLVTDAFQFLPFGTWSHRMSCIVSDESLLLLNITLTRMFFVWSESVLSLNGFTSTRSLENKCFLF